jgi:hypothetical protein
VVTGTATTALQLIKNISAAQRLSASGGPDLAGTIMVDCGQKITNDDDPDAAT